MRCITILSSFACSLNARSTDHGTFIFTEDGLHTNANTNSNGDGDGDGDGGGPDVSTTSMSTSMSGGGGKQTQPQTRTGMESPFVLPLVTGGILFIMMWGLWYWWKWYDRRRRRGGTVEEEEEGEGGGEGGEGEGEGESGRIKSTGMAAAPHIPKLWEVEIYHPYDRVGPLDLDHEHEVGKVRIPCFEFIRD
jgi:hypothetical protein